MDPKGTPMRRIFIVVALVLGTAGELTYWPNAASAAAKTKIEYFALGDSIASGHGLMDDGSKCHRAFGTSNSSLVAYPIRVQQLLTQEYGLVDFPRSHFLACSGAWATGTDPNGLDAQVTAAIQMIQAGPKKRPHTRIDHVRYR